MNILTEVKEKYTFINFKSHHIMKNKIAILVLHQKLQKHQKTVYYQFI